MAQPTLSRRDYPAPALSLIGRLKRTSAAELRFRSRELVATARDAVRVRTGRETWRPATLRHLLHPSAAGLRSARTALGRGSANEAHAALLEHFRTRSRRFVLGPKPEDVVPMILARFPGAREHARVRADRIVAGHYDVLGYQALDFRRRGSDPDWHFDPVHQRVAPIRFWTRVPFLDPSCGDHKIIWELNRHQHWLALGRAAWLTEDPSYARRFTAELESWLAANPPLLGINWTSMLELAFRSISWIWALHLFAPCDRGLPSPWTVDLLVGLHRQLEHIAEHLSVYFSPNTHLLGEALALYVAGESLPELTGAAGWANTGRRILLAEARTQVHADGGHAELSTHYHRYALDFYLLALTTARTTGDPAAAPFAEVCERLARYCRALADDRGRLPTIGDDDGGLLLPICGRTPADAGDSLALAAALLARPDLAVGSPPEEVVWMLNGRLPRDSMGREDPPPSILFRDTGYAVMRSTDTHAIVDAGRHGFLNGGHAHADALSLVLTTAGRPLLIDPGTSTYTMDPGRRDRFRSSAMHNTVTIDGRSQAIASGPFHWASRVDARVERWLSTADFDLLEASHGAYPGVLHRRAVLRVGSLLFVVDHVLGSGRHRAEAFWHFAPEWSLKPSGSAGVQASGQDGSCAWLGHAAGNASVVAGDDAGFGWCAPVYGQLVPSATVRVSREADAPFSMVHAIVPGAAGPLALRPLPISSAADGRHRVAAALRAGSAEVVVATATQMEHAFQPQASRSPHQVEVSAGRLSTDAVVAVLDLAPDGHPRRLLLAGAATARWNGPGAFVLGPYGGARDLHFDEAALVRLSRDAAPRPTRRL